MLKLLLALLLALFARGTPQTWYFAQLTDGDQVAAYTADGQVRPLVTGDAQFGLRVDAQTALVAVAAPDSDSARLYRMTPDQAVPIALPASADAAHLNQALAHFGDYVVLRDVNSVLPGAAFLINVAAASAEPLTGMIPPLARFSEDGQKLLYLSVTGNQWSLLERTMATDQERVIYRFTPNDPLPPLSADAHGDHWIITLHLPGTKSTTTNLIALDGTVTTLETGSPDQPLLWRFFGDELLAVPGTCAESCAITLRSGGSDTEIVLPAPGTYTVLAETQPGRLLVLKDGSDWWLLDANAAPLSLGQYDPARIFSSPGQLVSADGRYVLTATGDNTYGVWDLTMRTLVARATARFAGSVFYTPLGFLLRAYDDPDLTILYRYADQSSTALPNTTDGLYFGLLPDGTLLYMLGRQSDAVGAPGIYRCDPAAQTYTLLVANAHIFATLPLN